ncbi:MAG: ABC transporter ATP-binding protein, partial [Paramuribaculum sp.]|nr:ABC transporter ATP-binding protein [Paramuribaculum sp.]
MENRVAIELKNLSIGYRNRGGEAEILAGINAALLRGEFTCLIGSNGAGKSTLLRTIAGFLSPLDGEVIVEGKKLSDYSETRLAKLISVVLTDRMTLNNVSVRQVVEMGRSPYTGFWGTLGKEDREAVDEAMTVVGISNL